MPKRKRAHGGRGEAADAAQERELKKREVERKLVHGKKVLNRALKTARGFERQKLGKRIKLAAAKQDGGEGGRLHKELDVLKTLDLSIAVESYLYKTLVKSKSLYETGLLPGYIKADVKWEKFSPEELVLVGNVTARLYNSKSVKEAISHIVGSIYTTIGIQDPSATRKSKKTERGDPGQKKQERADNEEGVVNTNGDDRRSQPRFESLALSEGPTNLATEDAELDHNQKSETHSDDMRSIRGDHSTDEDFGESMDRLRTVAHSNADLEIQKQPKDTTNMSSQPSQSQSPPPRLKKSTKRDVQGASKQGSTFLPTLMGGYWSGSESATDDEENPTQQKKNRPGQQARRALWEKKFGVGANHLKGQGSSRSRDKDWDSKRGARSAEDGRFGRGSGGKAPVVKYRVQPTGENAITSKPGAGVTGKRDDVGPLHPSWEAAKKAKEARDAKQTAPFQGKKVVFE